MDTGVSGSGEETRMTSIFTTKHRGLKTGTPQGLGLPGRGRGGGRKEKKERKRKEGGRKKKGHKKKS